MLRKVLDVGQCDADHSRITGLLEREFDVAIQRANTLEEAAKVAEETPFDLVLINRILDVDNTSGMAVLHDLKSRPTTAEVPVMIVSNYQEAQDSAVESGGVRGFGKAALDSVETRDLLAQYLS